MFKLRCQISFLLLLATTTWGQTAFAQNEPAADAAPAGPTIGSTKINPKDGAEMVFVPAGPFIMGAKGEYDDQMPAHKVELSGYWIYKHLVTVEQYEKFCTATARAMPEEEEWGWKDAYPIMGVNYPDAVAYAKWAGVMLPTEAQWEKAARGTDGRKYPWGNLLGYGRTWSSIAKQRTEPTPVAARPAGASPYGCLDMVCNVSQWCSDFYQSDWYSVPAVLDPKGPTTGTKRVVRGGMYQSNNADVITCTYRMDVEEVVERNGNGLRCVMPEKPATK